MYRITVKVERLTMTQRRSSVGVEEGTPDLYVVVRGEGTMQDALTRGIRILSGERDAIMEDVAVEKISRAMVSRNLEDEEE
jgi:hypothetical protein